MKGLTYNGSNNSVQFSFGTFSHENLAVSGVADTSNTLWVEEVVLSLTVGAHVRFGSGAATSADMVLPAGVWPLLIQKGTTISVIKLTGSDDGQASVIIPM